MTTKMTTKMTEHELVDLLIDLLEDVDATEAVDLDVRSVRTFEDVGLLTTDAGVTLRLRNGQTFHLTVQEGRS